MFRQKRSAEKQSRSFQIMSTVLVVEDDEDTRSNLCDLLELDDHEVVLASSAAEAKDCLQSNPQITILDRKLPDGIAEDILPELRRIAPACEFIVVTGYADMESAISAMRNGASDYLLKPIQPEMFRRRLRKIAEVHQLEEELQREHEFANQILVTAEAVILVLNLDGTIQQFNPFLTELSGWSLEEVKNKDWFDVFIPENDRDRIREVFLSTAAGIKSQGVINPIVTRTGQRRVLRWSNSTLKNSQGHTTAVLAVGLDITDLAETQERALRGERLATIGQMMAALAHESRNALQRIQASTDLLGLEVENNVQAASDLAKIRRAANDLHVLLEEVRAFAAPIQLRKEYVCLGDIINQAWANIEQARQGRDVELSVENAVHNTPLHLDIVRAEQVFRNLFDNTLAATTDPVRISIELESKPDSDSEQEEQHVQISIRDNGPGLNAEQQEKIFVAFFTTKDAGTGLGMAIVQRIVEAHGGSICVDTQYDEGAKFNVSFPAN